MIIETLTTTRRTFDVDKYDDATLQLGSAHAILALLSFSVENLAGGVEHDTLVYAICEIEEKVERARTLLREATAAA